ncbi:histidine phosphatase family protein [Nocardioides sp.]|uniref:histidine phosphatase family protein n=1 Tax=Nocardioides sp. TaxID=35761 RepID=UPI00286EA013|nr:histidine phosphatase family protein [Nocardioides sp.]
MRAPVYLVRHGQSEWNVLRLTQGQTTHPALTALGREQAAAAAEAIARDLVSGTPVRVVTSDLVRAVETARIIGDRLGLVPELDARLREQHLGDLEGRSYEDSWHEAELHDWSDPELPVAGGESVAQVRRRLVALLAELDPDAATVVVSHGDSIRSVLAHLLGHSMTEVPWVDVPNGSVARYDGVVGWLEHRHPAEVER